MFTPIELFGGVLAIFVTASAAVIALLRMRAAQRRRAGTAEGGAA